MQENPGEVLLMDARVEVGCAIGDVAWVSSGQLGYKGRRREQEGGGKEGICKGWGVSHCSQGQNSCDSATTE
jgi:hypothetical protein